MDATATPQPGLAVTHAGIFASAYEKEFARALGEMVAGRCQQALEHLERAVVRDSKQRSIADDLLAGTVCVILDRPSEAIPHLERVVSGQVELPDDLMRHYLPHGLPIEIKIGDRVRVTLMLGSVAATLLLATSYEAVERYDEAIGVIQQLVAVHPEPAVKLLLCLLHAHKHEWQDVVTVAAGATSSDDIGLALCVLAGDALCELGLPDGAIQALSNALRSSSRDSELRKQARYVRATAFRQLGQQARSRKELEQLYAVDPLYRDVSALLGIRPQTPASNPEPFVSPHDAANAAAGAPKRFRFQVSAPAPETLDWLRRRAERSGISIRDSYATGFTVIWRGATIRKNASPAALDIDVHPAQEGHSRVAASVVAEGTDHIRVVQDFAGPLGARMTDFSSVSPTH